MNSEKKYSVGVDAGNSSVKIAVVDENKNVVWAGYKIHRNDILKVFEGMMNEIPSEIRAKIVYGAGSGAFGKILCRAFVNSTESLVKGVQTLFPQARSIAEIGSQNSQFISGVGTGALQFSSNKNCAAGTGSFFEDQMHRLGTKIEDYSSFVRKADFVPRLAGRCAVFAKTDIIHLQQDGEKTENILTGLTYSVVNNFRGTIIRNLEVSKPVFFAGGTSKNEGVIKAFKEVLHLSDDDLISGEESCYAQAAGTALLASEKRLPFEKIAEASSHVCHEAADGEEKDQLPVLKDNYPKEDLHKLAAFDAEKDSVFLGVDVGSTSTNFVLINQKNQLVDYQYFKTLGDSSAAVQHGFDVLKEKYGDKLKVLNSGVTGSGRINIGKKFNIPVVKDEITAQSTGTLFLEPECDTIFEIGGQDAKYISCKNGVTKDFTMNKVCSAGTGSFIEDQAERLGLSAGELGMKAFEAKAPSNLDQRCTVFMKTSVENKLALGESLENVCAGLCYSVVRNYLHKVVANKPVGNKICFQGGLAYNHGIVAAFKQYYGDRFSITPYFSVTGAFGMALIAKDEYESKKTTAQDTELLELNRKLFQNIQDTTFGLYKGKFDPNKKTVGIPRSLMIYKLFPFACTYFTQLGFNVKLSDETSEETIQLSQQLVKEETCFPIKLMHAHMQDLVDAGVDYIFMPSVYTMQHKLSNLKNNYGCVYMQTSARLVADVLGIEKRGIKLLNPILQMDMGAPHMALEMLKIGIRLGKNPLKCKNALMKSGMQLKKAQKLQEADGKAFLEKIGHEDKVLVLITRTYGLIDSVLNMGLPELLLERGCKVITLGNIEGHNVDIAQDYKNLYWPFSQHILSGAKIIKDNPNLYAVYLTNHGCGPDTMISHLFGEIMGEKPYLQIEVDEHYSKVGLITRIEAFLSNLNKNENKTYEAKKKTGCVYETLDQLDKSLPVYVPNFDFISESLAAAMNEKGFDAKVLPATTKESLNLGKDRTTSKEYVTFSALLGDVLEFERQNPKSDEPKQLLLFESEGSETDGFYATVIQSELEAMGRSDIKIFAPKFEDLIYQSDEVFETFWNGITAAEKEMKKACGGKVLVTGDPLVIFNKISNGGLFDYLKDRKVDYGFSSIAEYFAFMWQDKLNKKDKGIPVYGHPVSRKAAQRRLKKVLRQYPSVKKLQKAADSRFKKLSGANLRYRYAVKLCAEKLYGAESIIEVAPMYENGTAILNMVSTEKQKLLPAFQIQSDGTENKDVWDKLDAFLIFSRNWRG